MTVDPKVPYNARERTAVQIDQEIRTVKKSDWRGNRFKEREVRNAIKSVLVEDDALTDAIFEIVKEPRNGY